MLYQKPLMHRLANVASIESEKHTYSFEESFWKTTSAHIKEIREHPHMTPSSGTGAVTPNSRPLTPIPDQMPVVQSAPAPQAAPASTADQKPIVQSAPAPQAPPAPAAEQKPIVPSAPLSQ